MTYLYPKSKPSEFEDVIEVSPESSSVPRKEYTPQEEKESMLRIVHYGEQMKTLLAAEDFMATGSTDKIRALETS